MQWLMNEKCVFMRKEKSMNNHQYYIIICALFFMAMQYDVRSQEIIAPKEVYSSEKLIIMQISTHSYQHISWKQTDDFGNVPCNGLIVHNGKEVIVFDTPTNDTSAAELIAWVKGTLRSTIRAVIPTHFHDDCLGGLSAFHQHSIPSYAHQKTIELAKQHTMVIPQIGFTDSLILNVGKEKIIAAFFGGGHTHDNIVCYFPSEKILFGGCLIKAIDASKGYIGDADLAAWSQTVEKVKHAFPHANIVIPGHGDYGDTSLLDYTIALFKNGHNDNR